MATTVAASTTARKPLKAFNAILDEDHGVLTKLDGTIYFLSDAGQLTEIEPAHCNFLTVLGEVGLSECQALMDRLHGGAAAICTSREFWRN